jgi:hypothetical protein
MHAPTDIVIGIRLTREFPVEDTVFQCVETLRHHTHNFRPIFVDDCSDWDYKAFIDGQLSSFPSGVLIRTNFQHWFTRAFNLGLRLVRTPCAVLLNCDTVLDTGWLEELYDVKREVETTTGRPVGIVGSVLSGEEPRRYAICPPQGYVTGHALLMDMAAVTHVSVSRGTPGIYLNEIDPSMIHIRSDVEIAWKLMELGYQCVEAFKSAVGHTAGKTWGHQLGRLPTSLESVSYKY